MNAFFTHGDGTTTIFAWHRRRLWAFLIDTADLAQILKRRWHLLYNGYVRSIASRAVRRPLYLHRLLLEAQPGQQVHHINHDRLDNRRANLRMTVRRGGRPARRGLAAEDLALLPLNASPTLPAS